MVKITKTPECKCPNCKHTVDAAMHDDSLVPKVNDLSICTYCQALLVFDEKFILRTITEEEWNKFPPEFQNYITFERIRCAVITGKVNPEMN